MALTPTLIVERRRNALVDQWKQDPLIVVQVKSPGASGPDLPRRSRPRGGRRRRRPAQPNQHGDRVAPGRPRPQRQCLGQSELHGLSHGHIGFLNHVYGTQATSTNLAGYDVDHLLNRARSPGGAGYIRIEAVNRR